MNAEGTWWRFALYLCPVTAIGVSIMNKNEPAGETTSATDNKTGKSTHEAKFTGSSTPTQQAAFNPNATRQSVASNQHTSKQRKPSQLGPKKETVRKLLAQLDLSQYADSFEDQGYDDLAFLTTMAADNEQFKKLAYHTDMKIGHAEKLKTALQSRSSSTAQDFSAKVVV